MITFSPGRYCSHIWFIDIPSMHANILGALFRDSEHWTLIYRFRYDAGTDDPWDGQDRKSWYVYEAPLAKTETELLSYTQKCWATVTAANTDAEIHSLPVRSDDPAYIMGQLKAQPWSNLRAPADKGAN